MMRLMLLVLLVVCVGVCFCRPEGADAPYEDTCEEGDEVCYYLARLNQGHDDGDDDGGDGDVSSVESSHEGNGDSNNDEQHMDGLGRMDPLDSGEGRGMTGEYVAGEMVMESGKDINGRSGDMRSEEEDEEDMDEEDYLRTTVDGDDEGENEETTTHPSTSSPTSPTGPPTSRQKQYSAEGDKTTKSTYVSTFTQPPTTTETPTGPPAPDLARQGPKGVSLRRPRPGPFPTPFREPSMIGLVGFTVRGATNTRRRGRLRFKNVLSNLGDGWNRSNNSFRAPIWGLYYFNLHATSSRNSSFRLALIKDGKPQVYAYASRGYRHGFVSAVLRLTVSSKVSVELQQGALYEPRGNRAYTVLTGIIVGVDLRLMQSDRRLTSLRIIGSISDRVRAITAAEHDDVP